jgi:putative ABC transport system substrate-binding protein
MNKGIFALALGALLLAQSFVTEAQQPKKIPRIGYLSTSDIGADTGRFDGIRQRLRELGYIEGQNIVIDYRSGGRNLDRYREAVAELVRLKVDIIVVGAGRPASGL